MVTQVGARQTYIYIHIATHCFLSTKTKLLGVFFLPEHSFHDKKSWISFHSRFIYISIISRLWIWYPPGRTAQMLFSPLSIKNAIIFSLEVKWWLSHELNYKRWPFGKYIFPKAAFTAGNDWGEIVVNKILKDVPVYWEKISFYMKELNAHACFGQTNRKQSKPLSILSFLVWALWVSVGATATWSPIL